MTHVHYEITIDRPAREVWAILADFGAVHRYNPSVGASHLLGDSPAAGVGAARHCDLTAFDATAEERITRWSEGKGYTLEIVGGTRLPPFAGPATAELQVRPAGAERSVVTGDLRYRLRYGPVGRLMDRAMVRKRFGPAFGSILAGLKLHAETGAEITESTDLSPAVRALRASGEDTWTLPSAA